MSAFQAIQSFMDALYHAGLRHVILSPGSRSTPLTIFADRHPGISTQVMIDERSAAFFALGMAKWLNRPVGLICTSGTAAANYLPAVVEAHYARVPLVVMTADRPHEARDLGAPQTIDQIRLYGSHVKWFTDMPLPEENQESLRYFTAAGARAVLEATSTPVGPVHLNFPLREPLTPPDSSYLTDHRICSVPTLIPASPPSADAAELVALAERLTTFERGLLVCGPMPPGFPADTVVRLAERLGLPILADPLSGLRYGAHPKGHIVDAYDMILREPSWREALRPDYVIRLGALPTSKALTLFLKEQAERHIIVDPHGWNDAVLSATQVIRADPARLCAELLSALNGCTSERMATTSANGHAGSWLEQWHSLNRVARAELDDAAAQEEGMFEGRIFAELARLLPADAVLFVGNSMPVRDLDAFLGSSSKPLHPLANRGANGIDGVVSTALGSAVAADQPGVLVLGDLSFLHDIGGLLAARSCQTPFVIIVVNNDGGGIFSFLPQAQEAENFEALFGTPHGLQFAHAASLYGLEYARPQAWNEFGAALRVALETGKATIVEFPSERESNLAAHRRIESRLLKRLQEYNADAARLGALGRRDVKEGPSELC